MSRTVSGAAFIPTLYKLLGWELEYKYCMKGVCRRSQEGAILLFRCEDAETLIPDRMFEDAGRRLFHSAARRTVTAFPATWADSMGNNWYTRFRILEPADTDGSGNWGLMVPARPPSGGGDRNFIESEAIVEGIQDLIPQVRREGTADGG